MTGQYSFKEEGIDAFQWDGSNQSSVKEFVYATDGLPATENVVVNGDGSISIDVGSSLGTVTVPAGFYLVTVRVFGGPGGSGPFPFTSFRQIMSPAEFNNTFEDNEG